METENRRQGTGFGRGQGFGRGAGFGRGQGFGRGLGARFEDCPRLLNSNKEELQAYKERLTNRLGEVDARLTKGE